jgi:hypothetical protein
MIRGDELLRLHNIGRVRAESRAARTKVLRWSSLAEIHNFNGIRDTGLPLGGELHSSWLMVDDERSKHGIKSCQRELGSCA